MGSNRATNTVSPSSHVLDPFPVADLGAGEISKSFSISPARHALKAAGGFVCLFLIVFFFSLASMEKERSHRGGLGEITADRALG